MNRLNRRLLKRWKSLNWEGWWGDCIDVRFELAAELEGLQGKHVLDVGCGPGVLLAEVDKTNLKIGIDGSITRLHIARRMCPEAFFILADAEHLPFRDGFFDVVVLAGIIEYIEQKELFLQQISNLVRTGGVIWATTHNLDFWAYHGHSRLLRLSELEELFSFFPNFQIFGYNPSPSLVSFFPINFRRNIPVRLSRFLALPSPVLALIPGLKFFFRCLMKWRFLRSRSKAFFIIVET